MGELAKVDPVELLRSMKSGDGIPLAKLAQLGLHGWALTNQILALKHDGLYFRQHKGVLYKKTDKEKLDGANRGLRKALKSTKNGVRESNAADATMLTQEETQRRDAYVRKAEFAVTHLEAIRKTPDLVVIDIGNTQGPSTKK